MKVEPLSRELEPAWREFLRGREQALFYASLEYRDLLARLLDARPRYLVALEDERVRGVLPGFAMTHASLGTVLNSLPYYGANGGFVTDGRPATAKALASAWLALGRELGCAASTMISSPFDTDLAAFDGLEPTFRDERIGQVTPLPAGGGEEALFALYDETARRNVRKARKSGVAWRSDDGAEAMAFLYRTHEHNIRAIGGLPKARAFFDAVPAVPGEHWRLYVAEQAGERVAALLVFRFNRTIEYYTPAIVEASRPLQALALLVHEAMREAAADGYKWWNWGGTWKSQVGVYRFKRKWGAVDMPYHYYTRLSDPRLLACSKAELLAAFPGFFVVPFDELEEKRLDGVRQLYEKSLCEHGATPKGVGWRDEPTHELRFEQLSRLIDAEGPVSINDLGCGYGAFLEYLTGRGVKVGHFRGLDISERMLAEARRRHPSAEWILGSKLAAEADYSFASGIFNVRLEADEAAWRRFIERTLDELDKHSKRGFAFNLLSTYVDYREPHLYYGDPGAFFDLCKRRYSKNVALLHDYPLYEWTILVRK